MNCECFVSEAKKPLLFDLIFQFWIDFSYMLSSWAPYKITKVIFFLLPTLVLFDYTTMFSFILLVKILLPKKEFLVADLCCFKFVKWFGYKIRTNWKAQPIEVNDCHGNSLNYIVFFNSKRHAWIKD